MSRQRSLLSAAVAQWIEAERGAAPPSRGREAAFAQAEGAALLALSCLAWGGEAMEGAVRDTVYVPPMAKVDIAFTADNPGRWPFHCHHLY